MKTISVKRRRASLEIPEGYEVIKGDRVCLAGDMVLMAVKQTFRYVTEREVGQPAWGFPLLIRMAV